MVYPILGIITAIIIYGVLIAWCEGFFDIFEKKEKRNSPKMHKEVEVEMYDNWIRSAELRSEERDKKLEAEIEKLKRKYENLEQKFYFENECSMYDKMYIDSLNEIIEKLNSIIEENNDKKRILELEQKIQEYENEEKEIENE